MPTGYRVLAAAVLAVALTALQQPSMSAASELPRHATAGHEPLTAAGLVAALAGEGIAVPNPIDTTAQECPVAECQQAIVTDTIRVKSFAGLSQAKWYAATRGLPTFANIVVELAPPLTTEQRDAYLEAIGRMLP